MPRGQLARILTERSAIQSRVTGTFGGHDGIWCYGPGGPIGARPAQLKIEATHRAHVVGAGTPVVGKAGGTP